MRERTSDQQSKVTNLYPASYNGPFKPGVLNRYRQTGQCDDPQLKGILLRLHEGEALLSPNRAKELITKMNTCTEAIHLIALELLKSAILQVEALVEIKDRNERFHLNVDAKIQNYFKKLDSAVNRLLRINEKYGYSVYVAQPKKQHQKLEIFETNLKESKELVDNISYIQRYLKYQFTATQSLFERTAYPSAYFDRIYKYLERLPGECRDLAAMTRQAIANRVPGSESDTLI